MVLILVVFEKFAVLTLFYPCQRSVQGGSRTGFFNGFLRIAKKAKKRHKKALESVTDCYGRLQLRKNAKKPVFWVKNKSKSAKTSTKQP